MTPAHIFAIAVSTPASRACGHLSAIFERARSALPRDGEYLRGDGRCMSIDRRLAAAIWNNHD